MKTPNALTAKRFPRFVKQTSEQYHADHSAIGKSMLWKFHQRRRRYDGAFVTGDAPDDPATREQDLGSLAHAGLLQPNRFESLYAVFPEEVLGKGGREGTDASKAFRAKYESAGKIVVKQKDLDVVRAMVESAKSKLEKWLLLDSKREESIYWVHPETGLVCKCRPDWLIISDGVAYIFDLKTTTDASPAAFRYRCEDQGYWLQDRHYSEGVRAVTALPTQFYFVVVETEWPHACSLQMFDEGQRSLADRARGSLLRDLQGSLASGDFSESWESQVARIEIRDRVFESILGEDSHERRRTTPSTL